MRKRIIRLVCALPFLLPLSGLAQGPNRFGTTAANFLEMGIGSAGNALGEAYVSVVKDLSAVYWNPAGLAYLEGNEAQFMYQPWVVDISSIFAGVALKLPRLGTLAVSMTQIGYGETEVTTLVNQDGTGELYTANEYSIGLSFGRKLARWFSFGASGKYISSQIWHVKGNALAVDLGVIVNTQFFSFSGDGMDGLNIGMSISNYGTRMQYDGIDLLNPIDILPEEYGNFADVPGQFRMQSWELPLIFRIGASLKPIVTDNQQLTVAVDALHPNNNTESVNAGIQHEFKIPGVASFFLRAGRKALFMENSQYSYTFGGGIHFYLMSNRSFKVDYAFKSLGVLGNTHAYTIGLVF